MRRSRSDTSCLASGGSAADHAARWVIGVDRADHEDGRAAGDDRKRDPVGLSIQRKTYQFHGMREWIAQADIVEHRAALQDTPERIERGRGEEHRENNKVHHAGKVFELL